MEDQDFRELRFSFFLRSSVKGTRQVSDLAMPDAGHVTKGYQELMTTYLAARLDESVK